MNGELAAHETTTTTAARSPIRLSMRRKSPTRIGHVLPWLGIGGTELATLRLAKAAGSRGYDNVVFCPRDALDVQLLFREAGLDVLRYDLTGLGLRDPAPFIRNTISLARQFRRLKLGVIHCADTEAGIHVALAGRLASASAICHVRSVRDTIVRREHLLLSAVNRFAFVSRDTWSQFGHRVAQNRGTVLYDGIPARTECADATRSAVRQELGIPDDSLVVGSIARISPQKDFITLGRAAALIHRVLPDVRFLIVGDHSSSATYREHYADVQSALFKLGVLDAFIFTDHRADVERLMCAFDVFVLSTHTEGLPLVILEAMSARLPVVATAINGIPEVVQDGQTGLLFPHEDDLALSNQLLSLLTDRPFAATIATAGQEAVKSHFSEQAFASNLAALYEATLSPTGA